MNRAAKNATPSANAEKPAMAASLRKLRPRLRTLSGNFSELFIRIRFAIVTISAIHAVIPGAPPTPRLRRVRSNTMSAEALAKAEARISATREGDPGARDKLSASGANRIRFFRICAT
jgi:hypothetical protein